MKSDVEKLARLRLNQVAPKAARAACVASWDALGPEEKKQSIESLVFISFAYETKLNPDPFEHSIPTRLSTAAKIRLDQMCLHVLMVANTSLNSARSRMKHLRRASPTQ